MTAFSPDYLSARTRFRDAAARAGAQMTSVSIGAEGPAGEDLSIDVSWVGPERASRVLFHSAGVHGVEGFAGSAIQLQWLEGERTMPEDCAVVFVHVVNPYGMAWLRRANEHNVDLNRNCLAPGETYAGAPDGYARFDAFLNPAGPSSRDLFYPRACWLIARHGIPTLKQAIAGGQYVNPRGLFYGGRTLENGPRAVGELVATRLTSVRTLIGIDVHTGLGTRGRDTLLVAAPAQSPTCVRLRKMFGDRVVPLDPQRSPAYRVKGAYETVFRTALPHAEVSFLGQEFGTYGLVRVLKALREENRWHHHGVAVTHPAKRALKEIFVPADEAWRGAVIARGLAVIDQALAHLAAA